MVATLCFLAGWLAAAPAGAEPSVQVPKLSAVSVLVDGKMDEAVWADAAVVETFVVARPQEGAEPQQTTRVRVFRDERNLFVGFEAADTLPNEVRATFTDRDAIFSDDFVGFVLDPFNDRRRGFVFLFNPFGIQADAVFTETSGNNNEDYSWDTVYQSAGQKSDAGYAVEVRLPFASLRFDPERDVWGLALVRLIARVNEQSTWPPVSQARGGVLQQSGRMEGMRGIAVGVNAEVIPEVTARMGPGANEAHGVYQAHDGRGPWGGGGVGDAGITAKVSRAGIAGDVSVNPDFSQIESDAARIALNERFALYYEEKRPFFLEGREFFKLPWEAVYSRSIVDPIYGLKLTGKSGSTAFAVLHAVDQRPADSTVDDRWTSEAYGDREAITTAVRANTDLDDRVTMGMLFTDKHVGNAWNRVGGIDGSFLATRSARIVGHLLWAATDHPGGSYGEGSAAKVRFIESGKRHSIFSWYEEVSPGFRAEAGFLQRTGYRETGAELWGRLETGRKTGLVLVQPGLSLAALESTVDTDANRDIVPRLNLGFPGGQLFFNHQVGWERFRGEAFLKQRTEFGGYFSRKWLEVEAGTEAGSGVAYFVEDPVAPYLGGVVRNYAEAVVKPMERFTLSFGYERSIFSNDGVSDAVRQTAGRQGEDIEFDATVLRSTAQLFLSQAISARIIGDYVSEDDLFLVSGLLSYRPNPGTVVYLGYQDTTATGGRYENPGSRSVFVKMSYLISN